MYEKYDGGMVYLGDDSPLNIVSRGRVLIRFHNGRLKGIGVVLHILSLAQNLLSISTLNDVGVQVIFFDKGCNTNQGAMVRVFMWALCFSLIPALFSVIVI
jgi:hypothetical protein